MDPGSSLGTKRELEEPESEEAKQRRVQREKRDLEPVDGASISLEEAMKKFLKTDAQSMVGGLLRIDREAITVDELDNEVDEPDWWEDPELEFVEDGQALDEVYEESMWKEIEMPQAFGVFHVGDRKQLEEQDYSYLSTAWVEAWGSDGLKMRYVAREFKWLRKRFDLFTAASTSTTERMVDCIAALRLRRSSER